MPITTPPIEGEPPDWCREFPTWPGCEGVLGPGGSPPIVPFPGPPGSGPPTDSGPFPPPKPPPSDAPGTPGHGGGGGNVPNIGGGDAGGFRPVSGRHGGLNAVLNALLQAMQGGGFPQYGGQLTAGLTPEQQSLYDSFFGAGGAYQTGYGALSDIAQQDSLGRAEMLLQPARQRAIDETQRRTRERLNLGNNLLSTGGADLENRAVGNVTAQFDQTLANMIPQLTALRMQAAQGLPAYVGAGMGIGDILRGAKQDELTANYNEFLRTNPMGGPLQALISLLGGYSPGPPGAPTQRGPTFGQQALGFLAQLLGGGAGSSLLNNIANNPNWYLGEQRGPG